MREPAALDTRLACVSLPLGAHIRPLSAADAEAVSTLAGRLGLNASAEYWRRKLAFSTSDQRICLGVEVDGAVVACTLGQIQSDVFGLPDQTAFLELLGVDPDCQGRGLARLLAELLFERFAALGARRVLTLVSASDDTVRPFFHSLGLRQSRLTCLERRL